MAKTTYEKLMKAGMDLFHRHGIQPVGLDRILQKAGVTKTTFYNHFESKEVFACAVIDRFGEQLRNQVSMPIDNPRPSQIRQHLLGVFDAWDQLGPAKQSRGCLLMGAGVGSGDPNDPTRQSAVENKIQLKAVFRELAQAAGFKNPTRFAARFAILVDGSLVARHLYDDKKEADEARKMASELIDQEIRNVAH